jgi:glycosyltransferase involved in cell wall biosynthesis
MPLFSIIVPVHNRAHLIRDCVDSILAQRLHDFEIILVDNNSTDDLDRVLAPYTDPRLNVIRCTTPGPAAARMSGVAISRGRYLSFIDSDDVWREDVLEEVAAALMSAEPPAAVYLSEVYFRDDRPVDWEAPPKGSVVTSATLLEALWIGAPGACALAGVNREYFENGEGFAEELWVGEDLDWALRHAFVGPVCMLRDRPRLGYRRHDDNITKNAGRYETWAGQFLRFARGGRYATASSAALRLYIISHLMGQVYTLLCLRNFTSVLRLYPRIFLLGIQWRIVRPLFMPELFASFFRGRWQRLKSGAGHAA